MWKRRATSALVGVVTVYQTIHGIYSGINGQTGPAAELKDIVMMAAIFNGVSESHLRATVPVSIYILMLDSLMV